MRDLFVTMVVMGSLPLILYRPYIGILMWSWIGYMNPHRLSWGFAVDFPFAMIIAITTLTAMLFSRESKKIPITRETIVLLMFVAWMGITTLTALHPDLAQTEYFKVIKIQLMTFVTMMLMIDRRRIELLVWIIALSLGFYGVKGGIFTIASGGGYHVLGPPRTFIGGNNEMGLALIMTMPLMRYLHLQAKKIWVKWGLMAAMGLTIVAIFGTQSRGALLGLVVMALIMIWKTRRRFALLSILGVVAVSAFFFMPGSWHERMNSIQNYQEDASAQGRINAWKFAYNLAKARPLVGGGNQSFTRDLFARYAPEPTNVHDAHSIYFEVLGEHGFVGLFLFLLLGWFVWRSCSQMAKLARASPDGQWIADLATMIQVSIVGYATSGAFLGLAYFDLYYHLIAIVILLKVQVQKLSEQSITAPAQGARDIRGLRQQAAVVGRVIGK